MVDSIPQHDAPPEPTFDERLDRAFFSLGYLTGVVKADADMEEVNKYHVELRSFLRHARELHDGAMEGDLLRMKLSDILTRTANMLKGDPGPLSSHSWHDLPESAALAMHPDMKAIRHAAAPFDMWWAMLQAQEELGEQPIKDDFIIFSFSGSGASTMVTARQLRDMMAAIYGPAIPAEDAPCAS